jgi:hypothetical protein
MVLGGSFSCTESIEIFSLSEDLVPMDTPRIILYRSDKFLRTLVRVLLQFHEHGLVLRVYIGSFTGMEYILFFCEFWALR